MTEYKIGVGMEKGNKIAQNLINLMEIAKLARSVLFLGANNNFRLHDVSGHYFLLI